MNFKIITDSSCDLSAELMTKYNIKSIPLSVSIDNINYKDIDLDTETFYKKMKESKELPKTACPSPSEFAKEYECNEDNILVFTLTSKLSGTYSTAVLGKDIFLEDNHKNIAIIDTECGTVGHGLIMIKTAEFITNNKDISFEDLLVEIENIKKSVMVYGTLDTLDNAVKGGRMSPAKGKLANALNLKGLIIVEDGIVKPIGVARGETNSLNKVVDYIAAVANKKNLSETIVNIGHANCPEKAEKVKKLIEEKFNCREILINTIGPAMGTYTAEGAIIVGII